jgi:hypothetical protein
MFGCSRSFICSLNETKHFHTIFCCEQAAMVAVQVEGHMEAVLVESDMERRAMEVRAVMVQGADTYQVLPAMGLVRVRRVIPPDMDTRRGSKQKRMWTSYKVIFFFFFSKLFACQQF